MCNTELVSLSLLKAILTHMLILTFGLKGCCMSAGPEDTPYSGGCFEFDIYFPPTYPQVPMNVQIRTTGDLVSCHVKLRN